MLRTVKKIMKKTPVYTLHLSKAYSTKYNCSLKNAFKEIKVSQFDLDKILKKTTVRNIGIGNFFYSLDHSIYISHEQNIIGNIPVDYSYIINKKIGNSPVEKVIKKYVDKINNPRITLEKANDLKSALQAILFWNSLLWQTGHQLVGLGRLDKVLNQYEAPENAEELICDFLKTLHCEYDFKSASLKGDTGQVILLGGLEEDGTYFRNQYTDLFIKCLKKINLPDPKILLRCSKNMPMDLLELAMDCVSSGIGSPLFSNDDVVIPKIIEFGYDKKDAYNYGVSACWEPLSIGNSLEQNNLTNIEFGKCINETILDEKFISCDNFESVIEIYKEKLKDNCQEIKNFLDSFIWEKDPLLTYMFGLEKDISEGGAKYNNYGILSVGMSAAVNSLLNIKRFCFDKNECSLEYIQNVINSNYSINEKDFSKNENGFGIENTEAIELTNKLIKYTEKQFENYKNKLGGKVKFGLSSPSYIGNCSHLVGATLDGRKSGEPFQTHISRDKGEPITEIMNFESKLEFTGISSNANVLDVMIQASLIKDNVNKFAQYLMGGLKSGIFQIQMNVLSYYQLLDAKAHPEKYPNLIVRVWGFSAYFNDLPEEYKDNLIRRAKEMEMIA